MGNGVQERSPTFGEELDTKIWKTKGARFNAHRRLKNRHDWSLATIAFLSTYVIGITLLEYVPPLTLSSDQKDVIGFSAITLSLFILVVSLLEASKDYQLRAHELHHCARELSALYNKLRSVITSSVSPEEATEQALAISQTYDLILDRCPENHDSIDYDLFRAQNREHFRISWIHSTLIYAKAAAVTWLPYLFAILVAPGIVVLLMVLSSD